MDLQEEFLALLGPDAFHMHPYRRRALLVKFVVDGDERLGAMGHSSRFGSVGWEDLVKEVGQKRPPQVGVGCCCIGRRSRDFYHEAVGASEPLVEGRLSWGRLAGAPGCQVERPLRRVYIFNEQIIHHGYNEI
jgi:hypothetical protein